MKTIGNSNPLALCKVIRVTASACSSSSSMSDTRLTFSKNADKASSGSSSSYSLATLFSSIMFSHLSSPSSLPRIYSLYLVCCNISSNRPERLLSRLWAIRLAMRASNPARARAMRGGRDGCASCRAFGSQPWLAMTL